MAKYGFELAFAQILPTFARIVFTHLLYYAIVSLRINNIHLQYCLVIWIQV